MMRRKNDGPRSHVGSLMLIVCFSIFSSLVPLSEPAAAGQGGLGAAASINGQVTDSSGGVLPGVTVTATSPALQVPQVGDVTDQNGEFRLTPLPIGMFAVEYSLPGFQTVRRTEVRLTVGFAARLDQVLQPATISETITVSGASPVVDIASTATRTEITLDAIELLPTTRDGIKAIVGQVPGVQMGTGALEVGGTGLGGSVVLIVHGQLGEGWLMLEGVKMGSPRAGSNTQGAHIDFSAIEASRIQTSGSNAEMPRRGALIDTVVKSGGNVFHFDGNASGSRIGMQGTNLDAAQRSAGLLGAAKLRHDYDTGASAGGKLVLNKLWFFGSGRARAYSREVAGAFFPDGSQMNTTVNLNFWLLKFPYQMNPSNRFIGFATKGYTWEQRGASALVPAESREYPRNYYVINKGEWQSVHRSLVTSFQQGYWSYKGHYGGLNNRVSTIDSVTGVVTGDAVRDGDRNDHYNYHTKGSVSWFRPDLLLGNHEFKAGFDRIYAQTQMVRTARRQAPFYQLVFASGAPFQIVTWNYPVQPHNADHYVGAFVQDDWTIARRLTLSLGLRYTHDNAYVPAQCREKVDFAEAACFPKVEFNVWNSVAPRVHFALDVTGNAKTLLKGGWGRFNHLRDVSPQIDSANKNNIQSTTWTWRDLNGDKAYQPGEVNLNPNGPDFRSVTGTTTVPNPNEKEPWTDQFNLVLEREVMPNLAVTIAGIYSRNYNTYRLTEINRPYSAYSIAITRPDPGIDGTVGTADDPGKFLTYYEYPAALSGLANSATMYVNDNRANANFKTFELSIRRPLVRGLQLSASFQATKTHAPFGNGTTALPNNPNAEINTADDNWFRRGLISGGYTFPYGILASMNFEHRIGAPQARQVRLTGGTQITAIVINAEPLGSLRLPDQNLMDLRAQKRFALTGGRSLSLSVDVFNALNANPVATRILRAGPTYLQPVESGGDTPAVMQARQLRLGVSFSY